MKTQPLAEEDVELMEAAEDVLFEHFEPGRHRTGTAIRTTSGNVYTAVSLNTRMGTDAIHAEPIAIGQAILSGDPDIETSVAVQRDPENEGETVVVSACGICRELMLNYAPEAMIVVPSGDGPVKAPLSELLPAK